MTPNKVGMNTEMEQFIRQTYLPILFADLNEAKQLMEEKHGPGDHFSALFNLVNNLSGDKILEEVVSRHCGNDSPCNKIGYDVLCPINGKIEVRGRCLRHMSNDTWRADFITHAEMPRKQGHFDLLYACTFNHFVDELHWFKFPHNIATSTTSLNPSYNKDGKYGWAEKYRWEGPALG